VATSTVGSIALGIVLTSCGGYESTFSCKGYPDTPYCKSVSDAYASRLTPSSTTSDPANGRTDRSSAVNERSLPTNNAMAGRAESILGQPILKPARSFQAWVAPWKDSKRRLHESSIVYVVVQDNEFVYGHMTGKASGTKGERSRELYPRKGRMVEDVGMRKTLANPSGSTPPLPSKTSPPSPNSSADETYMGPGAGVDGSPSMPQGLPVLPTGSPSTPYLIDESALGGPSLP
jgi:conjugal transfer pilus assembly protein TraV